MLQYFQERFLYRLSKSSYCKEFALKGALLFRIYQMPESRPTIDIDFLGMNTGNSEANITRIFKEILAIEYEDGVSFDAGSLVSEPITDTNKYKGIRLFCFAYLGVAKRRIHFDIGFGDVIVPKPIRLEFPVLLKTQPAPKITAYTPESAIAEKFEAIVSLGYFTSRMKDFYDIYYMAGNYAFSYETLNTAIKATFKNRLTKLADYKLIFSQEFYKNTNKIVQWNAFITRIGINTKLSFGDCLTKIRIFLAPILNGKHENLRWDPEKFKWDI
jgi:hypothetical protein